jgi:hypothetical protein
MSTVHEITDAQFRSEVLEADGPVLVEFCTVVRPVPPARTDSRAARHRA